MLPNPEVNRRFGVVQRCDWTPRLDPVHRAVFFKANGRHLAALLTDANRITRKHTSSPFEEYENINSFLACLDFCFYRVCASQADRLVEAQSLPGFRETDAT